MDTRLHRKIAVVTAAGQGIGRATALAFAQAGATTWALDRNPDLLASLQRQDPTLRIRTLDVTQRSAIEDFVGEAGPVDILFNCVGIVPTGTILEADEETWDLAFNINVKSMFLMVRAFLPGMVKRKHGSIINMASVASSIKGVPNRSIYSATKAAVIGLTKSIAADYAAYGVRCNAICPGTVHTPSFEGRVSAQGGDASAVLNSFVQRQPLGRLGTPEEIAALVRFLASDDGAFITGTTPVIDGGWSN